MLYQLIGDCLKELGIGSEILSIQPLGGGSINKVYHTQTSENHYVIKINDKHNAREMFESERLGLSILSNQRLLTIPQVIGIGQKGNTSMLIMEYIEATPMSLNYWEDLGKGLAELHHIYGNSFGLDHNNFIGSLRQQNKPHDEWIEFFIEERLNSKARMAFNAGLLGKNEMEMLAKMYKKLPDLLPTARPSLLHGDLWSGNLIVDVNGAPCLIDPAIYYGHREVELAFTKLFGGFDARFYQSYNYHYPLETGHEDRVDIYNLYPLLVHLNLFGKRYLGGIVRILNSFT